MSNLSRRKLIVTGLAATAGTAAAARLAERFGLIPPDCAGIYGPGAALTYASQRLLTSHSMAREFTRSQISNPPFANGRPLRDPAYLRLQEGAFADWRLAVDGMVARPASFSLAELRSFPSRSQITHLACEEGWSFIAEWTGVPLSHILNLVGPSPQARYVANFSLERGSWDSIDMADALHPQTLVTYGMNGGDLPPGHGGPLRMRVPRQLGYKSTKYITRLTVTDSLKSFGPGLGSGPWGEGYAWYAGISSRERRCPASADSPIGWMSATFRSDTAVPFACAPRLTAADSLKNFFPRSRLYGVGRMLPLVRRHRKPRAPVPDFG